MQGSAVFEFRQVAKVFDLPNGDRLEAIRSVDIAVDRGRFISILGHSGCGKSTILNIVAGLLEPTEGEVIYSGDGAHGADQTDVGIVFQNPRLLPWKSVLDNVTFSLESLGIGTRESRRRSALELIEMVGLNGFENTKPNQLSGGMQGRTAIARALAINPRLLLMDEPFSSLDEITARSMRADLVRICAEKRMTVLFVTHDVSEAAFLSDEVIVLTPRPSLVFTRIDVPLERPRSYEDERLYEVEKEVLVALNRAMLERPEVAVAGSRT